MPMLCMYVFYVLYVCVHFYKPVWKLLCATFLTVFFGRCADWCLSLWPVKASVSEAAYVLGIAETFLSKGSNYFSVFLASCDKY